MDTSTHTVLHGPDGLSTADCPLDRSTHEQLVRTALVWSDLDAMRDDEYAQVGLLLAGVARVVADDVRAYAERLPEDDGRRLFAELVLQEADGRLSQPCWSLHRVQRRARLIRALYGRLDRLQNAVPTDEESPATTP
ncbi:MULTISPECIES: restriction endonuclease [unclassified Streptomyces]|uniref:restriction endonuclease n=1 Tax=unclassified Streptomyces TaxID=2593676 RepID=UPI002E21B46C|nr:restriction endonuclease [Streptomyces sp. NBC_01023]